jgi:hypothetical protein
MALFRGLTMEIPSVYLITNQEEISADEYDNIWTVIRKGRSSNLVLGEV